MFVVLFFCIVYSVHEIKAKTDRTSVEAARLEKKIIDIKVEIEILEAEWVYLNAPQRLAMLVRKHQKNIKLQPLQSQQLVFAHSTKNFIHDKALAMHNFSDNFQIIPLKHSRSLYPNDSGRGYGNSDQAYFRQPKLGDNKNIKAPLSNEELYSIDREIRKIQYPYSGETSSFLTMVQ
jgi:hypothetical protein